MVSSEQTSTPEWPTEQLKSTDSFFRGQFRHSQFLQWNNESIFHFSLSFKSINWWLFDSNNYSRDLINYFPLLVNTQQQLRVVKYFYQW